MYVYMYICIYIYIYIYIYTCMYIRWRRPECSEGPHVAPLPGGRILGGEARLRAAE